MKLPRNEEAIYYIDDEGEAAEVDISSDAISDQESSTTESNNYIDNSTQAIIDSLSWIIDPVSPEAAGSSGDEGIAPEVIPDINPEATPETTYKTVTVKTRYAIENFSSEALQALVEDGGTFYAIYTDGTEDEVEWTEVHEPYMTTTSRVVFEADSIGAASDQHFWNDANGAHVTDDEQDSWNVEYAKNNHGDLANPSDIKPWHNILMNSLGILLRRGLVNLVSISKSAIGFYDGSGNQATNVTALFGAQSAQIGRSSGKHVVIDNSGITAYDGDNVAPLNASNITAAEANIEQLQANTADISTIRANSAKVQSLTAEALTAATAYIAALNTASVTANDISADKATIAALISGNVTTDTLRAASAYISSLVSSNISASTLTADHASLGTVVADYLKSADMEAERARVATLIADYATVANLNVAVGRISNLESTKADISLLESDYIDADTIEANYLKTDISNTTVGWIENGTIKNGAITNAMINSVSANKLTAGTIDASVINVTNLQADDISVTRINGQTVSGKTLVDALEQHEDDISDLDTKIDTQVEALNDRIDGAIETFTGTAVPTLTNSPASSWNTTKLKDQHVGDVYYVVNENSQQNGYCYRFTKSGSSYSWQLIKDSDVTAALGRLQTAEGKISTIEQFDSDISSWKTDTDEEIASIKSNHTTLAGRVTTAEGELETKVDQTTFNTLEQTVGTNSSSITSLTTTTTQLRTDFDNIEIGGRNLLRGTAEPHLNSEIVAARATIIDDGIIRITPTTSAAYVVTRSRYLDFSYFEAGEYTLSFDAKFADVETTYTKKVLDVYIGYSNASTWNVAFGTNANHIYKGSSYGASLTNDWQRFSMTINPLDAPYSGTLVPTDGCSLRVEFYVTASSIPVDIRLIKLEKGNRSTAWSPAPEDVERKPNILRGTNQLIELLPFEERDNPNWSEGLWGMSSGTATNGDGEIVELTDGPDSQLYAFHVWSINSNNKDFLQRDIPLLPNVEYQISCYSRLTPNIEQSRARVQIRIYGYATESATGATSLRIGYSPYLTSTEWVFTTFNFVLTDAMFENSNKIKNLLIGVVGKGDIQICGVKLEQSDYVTKWAPSPFDSISVQNVNKVSNKVSEITQTIDGITTRIGSVETTLATKADGSTVESISSDLNDISETVAGHTQTISSINSTLSTKADGSTVSTLSSQVNDISDTVDGHTSQLTSITQTQTSIQGNAVKSTVQLWFTKANTSAPNKPTAHVTVNDATKANQWNLAVPNYNATYPNYYYCYEYQYLDGSYGWSAVTRDIATGEMQERARTAITNAAAADTKASNAATAAANAQADINSLEIGGRNLLRNTEKPILGSPILGSLYTYDKWVMGSGGNGVGSIVDVVDSPVAGVSRAFRITDNGSGNRDFVQFNATIENDLGATYRFSVWARGIGGTVSALIRSWNQNNSKVAFQKIVSIDTNWTYIDIDFDPDSLNSPSVGDKCDARFGISGAGSIEYIAPKLEKGNKATDWTPAPEDVDADISTAQTAADTAQATADKNVKESVQLWITKASSSAPAKPTSKVTSTAVSGNAWTTKVPTYNSTYPYYFYCMQYIAADGTVTWSDVVYDQATTEAQSVARTATTNLSTLQQDYATFKQTTQNFESTIGSTYATKVEATQMAQPNLAPFFTMDPTDVYHATTNPDGYWDANKAFMLGAEVIEQLADGWAHINFTNNGSGNTLLTIYEHCAWRHRAGDLKGSTKYTVMFEFRNVVKTGNVTCVGTSQHTTSWPSMFIGTSDKGMIAVADGEQYHIGTTIEDPSSLTGSKCTTRTLITFPSGSSLNADFRISLYEGEYSGPYKPYSNDILYATQSDARSIESRVTSAETSITQNNEAIALKANASDVYTKSQTDGLISTEVTDRNSAIEQSAAAINLSVSQTYSTKTEVSDAKNYVANAKNNYGYQYKKDIVIYGDSDKYYPVYFTNTGTGSIPQTVTHEVMIMRNYSEQAPADWNTATHKGSLNLHFGWNYGGWGGATYKTEIYEFTEMYSTILGDILVGADLGVFSIVFLRGGGTTGALYHIYSQVPFNQHQYMVNAGAVGADDVPYAGLDTTVVYAKSSDTYQLKVRAPLATPNTEHLTQLYTTERTASIESSVSELRVTADGISSEVSKISSIKHLTSSYTGWTLSNLKSYATDGQSTTFNVTSTANVRVGDTVYIKGTDSTRKCPVYIKATVTQINSAKQLVATSHGYSDALPVDSAISSINQSAETVKIQASRVEIDGTAIFNSISSSVDNAITDKGYATTSQAQGYATTAKNEAISAAASDATSKANTAKSEAISAAASDATTKANAVQTNLDNLKIGGRNLLPYTTSLRYSQSGTNAGITITYDGDGWFSVSGSPASGRTSGTFIGLWQNAAGNYASPVNDLVPQEGGVELAYSVETEGTPFVTGSDYASTTHVCFYGQSTGVSVRVGGFGSSDINKYVTAMPDFVSRVGYYVGRDADSSVTLNGRFRVKLENGNRVTDWTPAPEDQAADILASGVEYIEGTQTEATNLWTGVSKESALVVGKTISYRLPYAGTSTAATLELTLANGTTTGAKAIKQVYTTSSNTGALATVTTHWPVGSVIPMTYDGTQWIVQNYNTNVNQVDRVVHSNALMSASENATGKSYAVVASTIIGYISSLTGYQTIIGGSVVDISKPLLWGTGNIKTSTTFTNSYEVYLSCTLRNNKASWSGTTYETAYLFGTLNGQNLTVNTNVFTSTKPSTDDGNVYIPVGILYSAYQIAFRSSSDMYAYVDGKFQHVTPADIVSTHRIYYRTQTANASLAAPTTWVSEATNNVYNAWTTKVPPLATSTASGQTKYLYLYTCEQRKRIDGTIQCTKVLLDENTTVIDGGQIITNSITANQIAARTITATEIDATDLHVSAANVDGTLTIGKVNGLQDALDGKQASGDYATNSQAQGYATTAKSEAISAAASDATAKASVVQTNLDNLEIGGRNLLRNTRTPVADDYAKVRCTVTDGILKITPTTSSAYAKLKVDYLDYDDYGTGTYTVSCDVRLSSAETTYTNKDFRIYCGFSTASHTGNAFSSSYDRYGIKIISDDDLTYDWKRVSATFDIPTDLTVGKTDALVSGSCLSVQLYVAASSIPVEVRFIKLERGSKATDWTPAPEDAEADISEVQTLASTTSANLTTEINQRKASYGTCDTAAATAAKAVTCSNFELYSGAQITVRFKYGNTAAQPTLNVNDTGAKAVEVMNNSQPTASMVKWPAYSNCTFTYDGTYWRFTGSDYDQTTATNYITADDTGISIHMSGNSTTYQRQTATGTTFYVNDKKRSTIGADGLHVYVESTETEIASFTADGAVIGDTNKAHMELDFNSLKLIDRNSNVYMQVEDLRGTNGEATITDTFIADGNTRMFYLSATAKNRTYTVTRTTSDGSISSSGGTVTKQLSLISFETKPELGTNIEVVYTTTSDMVKSYTFGSRAADSKIGSLSVAEGKDVIAAGYLSRAVGDSSQAYGNRSIATGRNCVAYGAISEAHGEGSTTEHDYSFAFGYHVSTSALHQFVVGRWSSPNSNSLFVVGNGAGGYDDSVQRNNAFVVDRFGDAYISRNLYVEGTITTTGEISFAGVDDTSGLMLEPDECILTTNYKFAKKYANIATIQLGAFKLASALANGSTLTVGYVPSDFKPSCSRIFANVAVLGAAVNGMVSAYITSAGNITLVNRSGASLSTSVQFVITATYCI